jgi:hypothetical protein
MNKNLIERDAESSLLQSASGGSKTTPSFERHAAAKPALHLGVEKFANANFSTQDYSRARARTRKD